MRSLAMVFVAAGLFLSGCATYTPKPMGADGLNALEGQSLATTSRKKADFVAMTPGKASFAMVGAFAMIAAGNDLVNKNNIDDPAVLISAELAKSLATSRNMKVSATPVPASGVKAEQFKASIGDARYVLDVVTTGWAYAYFPTDWSHFYTTYSARLLITDTTTNTIVADGLCLVGGPKDSDRETTQDDLTANGAAGLKSRMQAAVEKCVAKFRTETLKL